MTFRIETGDCLDVLRGMESCSVQTCITSPPYWGLRDYDHQDQLGAEADLFEYVEKLVAIFREVRRVLRNNGTLWLNLGDCFSGGKCGRDDKFRLNEWAEINGVRSGGKYETGDVRHRPPCPGIPRGNLLGVPWRVAFALQDDGWFLRSDIIWFKPNCMPESVRNRPARSHEYLFLFSRRYPDYYWDFEAIQEPVAPSTLQRINQASFQKQMGGEKDPGKGSNRSCRKALENLRNKQDSIGNPTYTGFNARWANNPVMKRRKRDVWIVPTGAFRGSHFAVYPPELVRPCVLAGSPPGGMVFDPFCGAGTTGLVCVQEGRDFIGSELNPEYADLARDRIRNTEPLLWGQEKKG